MILLRPPSVGRFVCLLGLFKNRWQSEDVRNQEPSCKTFLTSISRNFSEIGPYCRRLNLYDFWLFFLILTSPGQLIQFSKRLWYSIFETDFTAVYDFSQLHPLGSRNTFLEAGFWVGWLRWFVGCWTVFVDCIGFGPSKTGIYISNIPKHKKR